MRQISEFERIEYNRVAAPWPVADRDTTLRSWVEANAGKGEVWARFQSVSVPEAPPVSGVVRMPRLAGYYHLEAIDVDHTKVTYQVDADPGGLLPDWLVKLTSRKLPIETIVGLRRQVAKTRGQHEAFLKKYDPIKGGKIPDLFANWTGGGERGATLTRAREVRASPPRLDRRQRRCVRRLHGVCRARRALVRVLLVDEHTDPDEHRDGQAEEEDLPERPRRLPDHLPGLPVDEHLEGLAARSGTPRSRYSTCLKVTCENWLWTAEPAPGRRARHRSSGPAAPSSSCPGPCPRRA